MVTNRQDRIAAIGQLGAAAPAAARVRASKLAGRSAGLHVKMGHLRAIYTDEAVDYALISGYITYRMVTKRKGILAHLDPGKAAELDQLAADTRILRSVLIREAIDDLLIKYGRIKPKGKPSTKPKP